MYVSHVAIFHVYFRQGAHIEHTPDVEDTRTEDERRLDEFVKSLKLKKSTGTYAGNITGAN